MGLGFWRKGERNGLFANPGRAAGEFCDSAIQSDNIDISQLQCNCNDTALDIVISYSKREWQQLFSNYLATSKQLATQKDRRATHQSRVAHNPKS